MAGMLPGVESARRRRFHQKSNQYYGSEPAPATSASTRRSSFCLYVSNHDLNPCSSTFPTRILKNCDESRLGEEAREAKKRLDERLQAQWRPETNRSKSRRSNLEKGKKSGSKSLNWLKLRWRSSEGEECVVCLEEIKAATLPENELMQLLCGHRFHTHCLLPWLEANAHCPCCRMEIRSSS